MKDQDQNQNINEVINLDKFRSRKSEEKKRKAERIFFHQLIGSYSEVQPGKIVPIEIIDVSEEGLAVQVPHSSEKVWPVNSNDIPIRLYFSEDSFLEVQVDVKNTKQTIDGGVRYIRYGCAVQTEHRSFAAWKKFVDFLRSYAELSERDTGNVGVGSL